MFRASLIWIAVVLLHVVASRTAAADSIDAQSKALDLITGAADRICSVVKMEGSKESVKVSGEVKAQLAGLIKQLADLGISGDGSFSSDKFQGLLQQELSGAIKQNADCKFAVFDKLQEKMIK